MSDLISRQDAIEAVEELIAIHFDMVVILNKVVVALMNIPSAEPKKGEWIPCSERLPEKDGEYLVAIQDLFADEQGIPQIGMANFEVDCEGFGFWQERFEDFGFVDSEWNEIPVIAWQPLPEPYKAEE